MTVNPIKSQLLLSEVRENTERKFGAANHVYPQWVETLEGFRPAQFIRSEVDAAFERARKNPEDMPPRYIAPASAPVLQVAASTNRVAAIAVLSALVASIVTAVLILELVAQ
jgi:hypothetical protein